MAYVQHVRIKRGWEDKVSGIRAAWADQEGVGRQGAASGSRGGGKTRGPDPLSSHPLLIRPCCAYALL